MADLLALPRQMFAGPLAPDIARGLRAAAATLIPFYLARELGHHELAWMAIGGWLGTLADPGGARSSRAVTLAVFAILGAAGVAVSEVAAPSTPVATLVLALAALGGSLVRAAGAAPAAVGTLFIIVVAIGLGGPRGHPVRDALWFAAGGAWAVVLSSILWPVPTHARQRISLAACWRALSDYADALADAAAGAPARDASWSALGRRHQREIRSALEGARAVALATRVRRSGETNLGSNLRTLLGSADAQFGLVVALADEVEAAPMATRRAAAGVFRSLATTYAWIAVALRRLPGARRPPKDENPYPDGDEAPFEPLARRLLAASAAAREVAAAPGSAPTEADAGADDVLGGAARAFQDDLRALRDALEVRSGYLRHAARVAVTAAVAQLVGRALSPTHSAWVTVTAVTVLQPYAGVTLERAVERTIGTVLGSLVAVALILTVQSPIASTLILVPLSVAAVATRPRSHRLFTFFLTPVFVLVAERWHGDWWIAAARAGSAIAGGLVALAGALAFPSREIARLDEALRAVIDVVRRYAEVVTEAHLARRPGSSGVAATRREVGTALGDAEVSLERLLAEPLRSAPEAEDAVLLLTHARRLSNAFTTLDARRGAPVDEAAARATLSFVCYALDEAMAGRRGAEVSPPSLEPGTEACAALGRIARRAEIVATSARRWAELQGRATAETPAHA